MKRERTRHGTWYIRLDLLVLHVVRKRSPQRQVHQAKHVVIVMQVDCCVCVCKMFCSQVNVPFVALWMRSARARAGCQRHTAAMGLQCVEGGGFRCLCGATFSRNQLDDCIDCWLQHGCVALQAKLREAVPTSSQPGQCGLWLREGEICPACGSREGGWVCGGSSEHVASCEEAAVVSGNWTGLVVDRSGALMTDVRRCCVHFDGIFRRRDPGIKAVQEHLVAHGKAARHYLARIATWEKSVRVERMPTFEEGMKARAGPALPNFSSRIRAFTRVGAALPPATLLQQLACNSSSTMRALPSGEKDHMRLRRGSVVVETLSGDGQVIMAIDRTTKKVQVAHVEHCAGCPRHPRCVCYHVHQYQVQWKDMQDIKGFVICLTPRFGWKHDFTLPLSKVCWRRAELLGNLEDFCAALKQS